MTEMDRRKFLGAALLSLLAVPLVGCNYSDRMTLDEIMEMLRRHLDGEDAEGDEEESGPVTLTLTYPAGRSPKVFTSGWVFGARAIVNAGADDEKDISHLVKWSGSGSFNPEMGQMSRPAFERPGGNTITISVDYGGKKHEKTVSLEAVDPFKYAAVGSPSFCPADAHGCPACPHPTTGVVTTGSPNVFVGGSPAARLGDRGVHAACCGPNTFEIISGDSDVLINGRPAATMKSETRHCGGNGHMGTP